MNIEEELAKISQISKEYLEITEDDRIRIRKFSQLLLRESEKVVSGVLRSLLSSELALEIIRESGFTEKRASEFFAEWFTLFVNGDYNLEHAKKVFRIGLAHARQGVKRRLMAMCMGAWLREMLKVIEKSAGPDSIALAQTLSKLIFWNLVIMLHGYHVSRVLSLERASGITPKLFDRLVRLKADEVYRSLKEQSI